MDEIIKTERNGAKETPGQMGRGLGGGRRNGKLNGYRILVWDNKKVLEIDSGDGNVNVLNATELYELYI